MRPVSGFSFKEESKCRIDNKRLFRYIVLCRNVAGIDIKTIKKTVLLNLVIHECDGAENIILSHVEVQNQLYSRYSSPQSKKEGNGTGFGV